MSQVLTMIAPVEQHFALNHTVKLAAFQTDGDARFLWGLDRRTETMFYLAEDTGREQHDYVAANVVCPVPGCAAALISVHGTTIRDHLRHVKDTGGHGPESVFHSQGCALIQSWLATKYPGCKVTSEEYTNAEGERRADILITAPSKERIAFEVQYSPLTPDAWTARHNSYQAQGIQDVWLFGHTEKQLKLDTDGALKSNPTLSAVAATGAAVLFINPTSEQLAIAVTHAARYRWRDGWIMPPDVAVIGDPDGSQLEIHPLADFRLELMTFTSDRVEELRRNAAELIAQNAEQQRLEKVMREQAERNRELEKARIAAGAERAKKDRGEQAAAIRVALDVPGRWDGDHPAVELIRAYVKSRRPRDLGDEEDASERWKSVAYFYHVAGNEDDLFDTKQVAETLRAHGIRLETGIYRVIGRWLHGLVDEGFLFEEKKGKFSAYRPTFHGTIW